jgi:hypothetical protein
VSEILPGLIMVMFVFIGYGLLGLFARDILWDFAQFGNAVSGRTSQRTPLWEAWQRVMGVVCILIGVGIGVMAWNGIETERLRNQPSVTQPDPTAELIAQLDRTFGTRIASLQAESAATPQALIVHDGQSRPVELEYGQCADGSFYAVVLNFGGETGDYVYTTRNTPCRLDHAMMLINDESLLGESAIGGRWFRPVVMLGQPEN